MASKGKLLLVSGALIFLGFGCSRGTAESESALYQDLASSLLALQSSSFASTLNATVSVPTSLFQNGSASADYGLTSIPVFLTVTSQGVTGVDELGAAREQSIVVASLRTFGFGVQYKAEIRTMDRHSFLYLDEAPVIPNLDYTPYLDTWYETGSSSFPTLSFIT